MCSSKVQNIQSQWVESPSKTYKKSLKAEYFELFWNFLEFLLDFFAISFDFLPSIQPTGIDIRGVGVLIRVPHPPGHPKVEIIVRIAEKTPNGMSSFGDLGRFFETA
jgi:hypothetical protein